MTDHSDDIVLPVRVMKSFAHARGVYEVEAFALADTVGSNPLFTARTVNAADADRMYLQLQGLALALYESANREILDRLSSPTPTESSEGGEE